MAQGQDGVFQTPQVAFQATLALMCLGLKGKRRLSK